MAYFYSLHNNPPTYSALKKKKKINLSVNSVIVPALPAAFLASLHGK